MNKKINVVVSGCCGKMGKKILEGIKFRDDMNVVAGINRSFNRIEGLRVFTYETFDVDHDVIIDFSHVNNLDHILNISEKFNSKLILCTTGYSNEQLEKIKRFSNDRAIFLSSNTSLGINLLIKLSKLSKRVLGDDFDIEIIEKHHNKKIDAPSGTALTIAKEISDDRTSIVFNRSNKHCARSKNEIGISSVRGGSIKGEHEVLFISDNEILTIHHSSYSRDIFAKGALDAVKFIMNKGNGLYKSIY